MMGNNPLVSVNILSFNRREELRNTLTKVYEQNYKNIEVIVIDNASIDGTKEMVENEFDKVKLIALSENIGASAANLGFKISKGEYIMILDDDSFPERDTIEVGLKSFMSDNKIGIVALKIYNKYLNVVETEMFKNNSFSFIGCGALFKKELIELIGGYSEDYFLYHNELDLSARSLKAGYSIIYNDSALIVHNFSPRSRGVIKSDILKSEKRYYYFFVGYSIFIIQNYQFKYLIYFGVKLIVNRLIISIFYSYWKIFFKALFDIMKNFKKYFKKRSPFNHENQKKYLNLIAFIDRDFFPNYKNH